MKLTPTDRITQALAAIMRKKGFATKLGSRELTAVVREMDTQLFFSARTTQAAYVEELKKLVERYLKGGFNNDLPMLRIEARKLLARFSYTPERGFPGDEELGVPPAEPGSLQDLRSERRLNLILDTQRALAAGLGKKTRGLARMNRWPAWELIRVETRRVPRGTDDTSMSWGGRWVKGGKTEAPGGKMIALKTDPIWAALGDAELFDDALDTDHPPFAFNSGMGWREVPAEEWRTLNIEPSTLNIEPGTRNQEPPSVARMDDDVKARLIAELKKRPDRSVSVADLAKLARRAGV